METAGLVFILISAFACVTRTNSLEYSDLEALGVNCPSALSCAFIDNSNFTTRNCECDHSCVIYQDCCIDARVRVTSRNRMNSAFTCMPFGREPYMGANVVQTCSRNYSGPAAIQRKCQNQNNVSDPLMAAPVTDTVSETSYWNRYCAECNNVDVATLESWLIQMYCRDFTSIVNVSNSFVWQNLQYRPNLNKWGVDINGRFYTCNLNFEIPSYLQTKVRFCQSEVVSTCPKKWSRTLIKEQCESYTSITYAVGSETVYRNAHCAICNGMTVRAMRCNPRVMSRKEDYSRTFFIRLFYINNTSDCGPNQIYDPYAKKCRNLIRLKGNRKEPFLYK